MKKPLEKHQFYAKFANLPITDRFVILDMINHGDLTMLRIYEKIKLADEKISEQNLEIDRLLRIAEVSPLFKK
jgi:hypothetical protein